MISDIDDTVVLTGATSPLRMARTVFLGNARTRAPFPGVAAFYAALQHGVGRADFNPLFYVSSSPWNLYGLLTEFLTLRKIPLGPLMLRDWGINEREVLPTGHAGHKLEAIRKIMELYPDLPFILLGDSGQEDPEIYHRVVHDHPSRILAVYIRNVHPAPDRITAVRKLAEEVERAGAPCCSPTTPWPPPSTPPPAAGSRPSRSPSSATSARRTRRRRIRRSEPPDRHWTNPGHRSCSHLPPRSREVPGRVGTGTFVQGRRTWSEAETSCARRSATP